MTSENLRAGDGDRLAGAGLPADTARKKGDAVAERVGVFSPPHSRLGVPGFAPGWLAGERYSA